MIEQKRKTELADLIEYLKSENPRDSSIAIPNDIKEEFDLFRVLSNIRIPKGTPLPAWFLKEEGDVLENMAQEKGVKDMMELLPSNLDKRLFLWKGDITLAKADAIVNAANTAMLGCFIPLHNCIDNCIHTMAGVELREECYSIMKARKQEEVPVGTAILTSGYHLPARYVIHTVGPCIRGRLREADKEALALCYRSVLDVASKNQLHSVVFCCISTGVFRFPHDIAAAIAVNTTLHWLETHFDSSVQRVIFDVYDAIDERYYQQLLN